MTKTIFLLNIDNFAPEITRLTYPFIRYYAERIGAEIVVINERKFPDWPVVYEKMQIYELAQKIGSDWNIYIDLDTLIHPECLDFTAYLDKSEVCHHYQDIADIRWRMDEVFLRDGRHIGSCNWFTIASDWCIDLWKPLEMSFEDAVKNIHVTPNEFLFGMRPDHLIDDYTLSRNIARFGLKFKNMKQIYKDLNCEGEFLEHQYVLSTNEKVERLEKVIFGYFDEKQQFVQVWNLAKMYEQLVKRYGDKLPEVRVYDPETTSIAG